MKCDITSVVQRISEMDEFVTGLAQTIQVTLDSHFAVVQYNLCVVNSFSTEVKKKRDPVLPLNNKVALTICVHSP